MDNHENGYPTLLRSALTSAKSSRSKLSRELAEETGNKQGSEYRALGKYLAGDETPAPDRAAIIAVLLRDPRLALVSDARTRRQNNLADRLEELAKTVQQLRDEFDRFVRSVSGRRVDFEEDQELPTHRADQPSSPEAT